MENTQEWHKKQAIECFNATWDYIDKKDRTEEDNLSMVHLAHASRYHWEQVGTPLNLARGEWQISRVYSLLNMPESALLHAKHSLKYCLNHDYKDFDLAFAYEAIARAYMIKDDKTAMQKNIDLARNASNDIKKSEDKDYFLNELNNIK